MLVADLQHFLDLPPEVPGPARRLGEHLCDVVRAATAAGIGDAWESALPCRSRPARTPCPGRMVVQLAGPEVAVHWRCSRCADEGTISNWAETPFDLRRRRLALAEVATAIVVDATVAPALRDLRLLDCDSERVVYRMRAHQPDRAVLTTSPTELDDLLDALAAEANAEQNRARRRRLDSAYQALLRAAGPEGR